MRPSVAAALALLLGAHVLAQTSGYRPDWNRPATPHRVVSNVYFVGTGELGIFLIATRDGHIVVDAGFDETVPLLEASLQKLGFEYEGIRVLLSSHAHAEHAAGLARVKRETGARVMALADDAALLQRGGRGDPHFGDERTFPPVTVDRVLKDGDVIEHGGQKILVRHTPGHTRGAATFVTTVQENGRALQMVFAASTALDPEVRIAGNPRYPRAIADWQRTYAILESLVGDVWVSGHTGVFDMPGKLKRSGRRGVNPYVDPQGYRRHLADSRAAFNTQLAAELSER